MADYDSFDRTPTKAESIGNSWRAKGLHPVYKESCTMTGSPLYLSHFQCRRGCGTLVWSPEDHIKNVCPTFDPVAG